MNHVFMCAGKRGFGGVDLDRIVARIEHRASIGRHRGGHQHGAWSIPANDVAPLGPSPCPLNARMRRAGTEPTIEPQQAGHRHGFGQQRRAARAYDDHTGMDAGY
jgi:hypothetical protein